VSERRRFIIPRAMKIGDVLMLFAVLLSPVIAVQVQVWLELFREKRNRKFLVFQTLMATRTISARTSPEHVRALNMIDLTFYGDRVFGVHVRRTKAERLILDTWKRYFGQLSDAPDWKDANAVQLWANKRDDLFVNLLHSMAQDLGYSFDKLELARNFYAPMAQGTLETELTEIRASVRSVLTGGSPISVKLVDTTNETVPIPPVAPSKAS
jgi:hypothetical protein